MWNALVLRLQGESAQLERQVGEQYARSQMLQRDLAASLKDSKEALHREVEIMAQLEAQDEVQHLLLQLLCVCVRAATDLCFSDVCAVASQHTPFR